MNPGRFIPSGEFDQLAVEVPGEAKAPCAGINSGDGAGLAVTQIRVPVSVVAHHDAVPGLELVPPRIHDYWSVELAGGVHADPASRLSICTSS